MPVGHPTLMIKNIAPSISPAFSPNLYRWLKAYGHAYDDGGVAETVYRVVPDTRLAKEFGASALFIGCPYEQYEGDTDFSGSLLISVLCNGSQAKRFCYAGAAPSLVQVEGFWDNYLSIGRCAIDTEHNEHFYSVDRYIGDSLKRTCLWCGWTSNK